MPWEPSLLQRPDLAQVQLEHLAPIEALLATTNWPQIWRDLAVSHYVTLIHLLGSADVERAKLARLAKSLTLGIVQDIGGTQPYIASGDRLLITARAQVALQLLAQGKSYRDVARATGVTPSRVRQIESDYRRQKMQQRQSQLPLDD